MTEYLVAIHKIGGAGPGEPKTVATGRYNDDGTPILAREQRFVAPGTLFPASWLKDGERMLALGAVRPATDLEIALHEKGAGR